MTIHISACFLPRKWYLLFLGCQGLLELALDFIVSFSHREHNLGQDRQSVRSVPDSINGSE